jgi:hypothetical protein
MLLNIITPCCRPVYLPIIACHLQSLTKLRIRWFVGFEANLKQETPLGNDLGHNYKRFFEDSFRSTPEFEIVCWTRDSSLQSVNGTAQRNEAIEPDDWIAFLDDDTLLPHDYEKTIFRAIDDNPSALGFVFQQLDSDGDLRMDVSSIPPRSFVKNLKKATGYNGKDGCDTGQMLFKRRLIGNVRWKHQGAADHPFYKDVALDEKNIPRVKWLNVPASIHNALRI